jgi:hypothetical protein
LELSLELVPSTPTDDDNTLYPPRVPLPREEDKEEAAVVVLPVVETEPDKIVEPFTIVSKVTAATLVMFSPQPLKMC